MIQRLGTAVIEAARDHLQLMMTIFIPFYILNDNHNKVPKTLARSFKDANDHWLK